MHFIALVASLRTGILPGKPKISIDILSRIQDISRLLFFHLHAKCPIRRYQPSRRRP